MEDTYRMDEGQILGCLTGLRSRFCHQVADSSMDQQERVEFLLYQFRSLAAQHHPAVRQVGFEFIETGFDGPALMIKGG